MPLKQQFLAPAIRIVPDKHQRGKLVEGAIGMVWNHLAVKLATRRSNFLCSRLAVPLRIVPDGASGTYVGTDLNFRIGDHSSRISS